MLNRNLNLEALAIPFASNNIFISGARVKHLRKRNMGAFPFVPPVRYAPPPPQLQSTLHSKSLCKNMARASVGCKLYAPTKLGGGP